MRQRLTVIHDGSGQGWQAVYVAFHVAARLHASLLAISLANSNNRESSAERILKMGVGARAAGLTLRTGTIHELTVEAIEAQARGSGALLLPKDLFRAAGLVPALVEALACPVWLISREHEIRRLGVVLNGPASAGGALHYASTLAFRWNQPLICLTSEAGLSKYPRTIKSVDLKWKVLGDLSAPAIQQQVSEKHIDLVLFNTSQTLLSHEFARATTASLVLCPGGGPPTTLN
jgi:hypothetical protein